MNLSIANALLAVVLGLTAGGVILGVGIWIDRARERSWQREIDTFNEWDES